MGSTLDPTLVLRPPNLTPDPTGVLLNFRTEAAWIERFRTGRVIEGSIMPWGHFARMTDEDLAAIYRYLHSLDPVAHAVGPTAEFR